MRTYRVRFDVFTEVKGKRPKRHVRWLLVQGVDDDAAEAEARKAAVPASLFGQRVLAIEWRQTSTQDLPFDLTEWAKEVLLPRKDAL